jgi:hypothetical protein
MGIFNTQFEMNNVLTHVTVEELEGHTFACRINLADFRPTAELPSIPGSPDIVLKHVAPGQWEAVGQPKVALDKDEIQSLGNAIEGDKTVDLFGPEAY